MWSWINGTLTPIDESRISVTDHGFTVGDGVFETLKIENGQAIAVSRHLARLRHSAVGMGLPLPDDAEVREAIRAVLDAQAYPWGVLRITYTSGPGPLGSNRGDEGCTLAVVSRVGAGWPPTSRVTVSPWPRNERSPLKGLKTTSYAENAVCLDEAKRLGADEALLANLQGRLCEGTGTNVFIVTGGRVYTPPLSDGCLAGITRGLIVEWFEVEERSLPLDMLNEAEEVFVTSSTRDVHPVSRIGDRELVAPGPITKQIATEYLQRLSADPDPA